MSYLEIFDWITKIYIYTSEKSAEKLWQNHNSVSIDLICCTVDHPSVRKLPSMVFELIRYAIYK